MKNAMFVLLLASLFVFGCTQLDPYLPTKVSPTAEVSATPAPTSTILPTPTATIKPTDDMPPLPPSDTPTTTPAECKTNSDCATGGCSGEVCTFKGDNVASICIYKAEYACYKLISCGCNDGKCDWQKTSQFNACISGARQSATTSPAGVNDLPPLPV